jgi:pullulanase/glycogen debranching enzyme
MLAHGQEMGRSKQGIANAHNQDNEISWVDWSKAEENADLLKATGGVNAHRARRSQFHYDRGLTDKDIQWLLPENEKALGWVLPPVRGKGEKVVVLTNFDHGARVEFKLPDAGKWNVIADGETLQVDEKGLRTAEGTYSVPPGVGVMLSRAAERK